MPHLYHANATMTVKIREEIKQSTATIKVLSRCLVPHSDGVTYNLLKEVD